MVFTSHIFIFYYLPLCLLLYYALDKRWRNLFLTLASYVFYGWWKPWFVTLMMISTVVDYIAGRMISAEGASPRKRKTALVISLISNLGLLAVFKYAMFAQENVNMLLKAFGGEGFSILQITLPIGISFYTFQTMSYSIDVYLGKAKPVRRFIDFSCFVALFPQLIAGPIVRYSTIAEQLATRDHTMARFSAGISIFAIGFAKKILLANPMGTIADTLFAADGPMVLAAWFGVIAYAFQIYFDFSGYSDMAIGLGRMLGFEFPKNFDSPYHSQSITEFWRRWHISLSSWLRDYLYLPLGGNRKGTVRTYINLAAVMLFGGLWHGAQWQFVVWGAWHGSILSAERWIGKKSFYTGLPKFARVALTFVLVLFSWVLFRADNLTQALGYMGAMLGFATQGPSTALLSGQIYTLHNLVLFALCALVVSLKTQSWDFALELTWGKALTLIILFLFALAAMFAQSFNPFLYFQF
ncbi:MAG: MBOAT family protein [Deltaproteobacteria bacterium]|nr:MBOAT family protein [Deltaproteobacteria bacterium]